MLKFGRAVSVIKLIGRLMKSVMKRYRIFCGFTRTTKKRSPWNSLLYQCLLDD